MKRVFVVVSLLSLIFLVGYLGLSQKQTDQVSADADSDEFPVSVVLPLLDAEDEVPLAKSESPVEAAPDNVILAANPEDETGGSVQLEDRMRFVDGIELPQSRALFEWLLSEEGRDEHAEQTRSRRLRFFMS